MTFLLAIIVSQTPPSKAYLNIENNGADAGFARVMNITSGGTCTVNGVSNVAACSFPGGSGSPGGSPNAVQFKTDGGVFGGMSAVNAWDGTHLTFAGENGAGATPPTGREISDWAPISGMPNIPYEIDAFFGVPNWSHMTPPYSGLGTNGTWSLTCHTPDGYSVSNLSTLLGTATVYVACPSTTGWGFDAGTVMGRARWAVCATSASINTWTTMRATLGAIWRGNTSGAGGFLAWERIAPTLTHTSLISDGGTADPSSYVFAGWMPCGVSLTGTADSSATLNTFYVGCNAADTTLHVCSNDGTGSATCSDLGSNFPCRFRNASTGFTDDAIGYDVFFYAAPFTSSINWYLVAINSGLTANGTLSSDLPSNAQFMCYQAGRNSGHDGGTGGSMGVGGVCEWSHL